MRSFPVFIAFVFVIALTRCTFGQSGSYALVRQPSATERRIQMDEQFPVGDGWKRVRRLPVLELDERHNSGVSHVSTSKCAFFFERRRKSLWLYFPFVDSSYASSEIQDMRMTVFGLDSENKLVQIQTCKPVRWTTSKATPSVNMLEFQIDSSNLGMVPREHLNPGFALTHYLPSVFFFLEARDPDNPKNTSTETTGKQQLSK